MKKIKITLILASLFTPLHFFAQSIDSLFGIPSSFYQIPGTVVYGVTGCDFDYREDQCYGIFHLNDGSIILAGDTHATDGTSDFALARLTASGQYDETYGPEGEIRIDLGFANDSCLTAAAYGTEHILMGGTVQVNGKYRGLVAKVDFAGQLDASFGNGGVLTFDLPDRQDMVTQLIALPDGSILVGGNSWYGNSFFWPDSVRIFIGRLNANGTIDSSFGVQGFRHYQFESACNCSMLDKLVVDSSGRILFTGGSYDPAPNLYDFSVICNHYLTIVRLLPDGSPDDAFGDQGKVVFSDLYSRGRSILTYPDGRILVVGNASNGVSSIPFLSFAARLLENGALDNSFAQNGIFKKYITMFGGGAEVFDVKIVNGKIILGILDFPTGSHLVFGLYCLIENGQPDLDFGYQGQFIPYPNTLGGHAQNQITTNASGDFFVSGYYRVNERLNNMIVSKINLDDISGTNQPATASALGISPNPTTGIMYLHLKNDHGNGEPVSVTLRDIHGRIVNHEWSNIGVDGSVQVQAPSSANGIHIVEVVTDGRCYVGKVMVQR